MTGAIRNHRTLIAEQSAPSLLAVALPGLLAGPMQAARVADAVVTVTPFEPHSAPVDQSQRGLLVGLPFFFFTGAVYLFFDSFRDSFTSNVLIH